MTSKTIDGVEIHTYSVRKNYSEQRERNMVIAILAIMLTFSAFAAFANNTTDQLIEITGAFISNHN